MDPATIATIVGWFVQPAMSALFNGTQQYLLQRLGVSPSRSSTSDIKPLLDEYLQRLTARLDEDRIARLYGAFSKLKDAPKSSAMRELLIEALDGFHQVAQIPQQGTTRGRPNAELCCMAFVGMAASYNLLHAEPELIAEKMVEAIRADADTAKQWLGEDIVREILARLPAPTILCPQCGFQNPAGSKFCNRDGYPLDSPQKQVVPQPTFLGNANAKPRFWPRCQVCGTQAPWMRVPKNMNQFGGGWTCEGCGTELNRHGRPHNKP